MSHVGHNSYEHWFDILILFEDIPSHLLIMLYFDLKLLMYFYMNKSTLKNKIFKIYLPTNMALMSHYIIG